MEQPHLRNPVSHHSPLLPVTNFNVATPPSRPTSSPNLAVLTIFLLVVTLSQWANYEASKGFDINVLRATPHTAAGRRFNLFFVDNGRAISLILAASSSVQRALFPDDTFPRKPVHRVTVSMDAAGGLNDTVVAVRAGTANDEFEVLVSPTVMEAADVQGAVEAAVWRGMARMWLWDGRGKAPRWLLDAVVEHISPPAIGNAGVLDTSRATFYSESCWSEDVQLAQFMRYCEAERPGFVARLNGAMESEWSEKMLDDALGASSVLLCSKYRSKSDQ
ncbi:uncharacterized protein LOC141830122 [Curcuma longa]|uniref:uncharacterized protein LOC141830122 n=1 Tax=Curcuma longa TaxID=136217 RepID=UPI003D9DC575